MNFRIGNGFDVHQLIEDEARPLMLGGVELKSPLALRGHSDADVVLHALTDAILGSISAGDIGQHFPPSDEKWKDASSDKFLQNAIKLLKIEGFQLSNADITIICEAPKIAPHQEKMQERIAGICNVEVSQISVKATTTEKLGFTGRREGIACMASVLVYKEGL